MTGFSFLGELSL